VIDRMHLDRSVDNIEQYKMTKKTAKRVVSEARSQIYDRLFQLWGTKEGENCNVPGFSNP
jgi:hypothetical protein